MISDGLWRRGFGGDPNVLGRTLRIDNDVHQVIGVVSKDFRHPSLTLETDAEVWAPSGWKTAPFPAPRHSLRFLPGAIGRLKPGVTIEQARARLEAMGAELRPRVRGRLPGAARLGAARPAPEAGSDRVERDGADDRHGRRPDGAGHLLREHRQPAARPRRARQREMAIRRALGASSGRIAREQLIESAVVAAVGGGLGLLLTLWALDGLMQLAPESLPRRAGVGLNWTVALFALASALVTGLVFGVAPALQAARASIQGVLKDSSRSATPESRAHAARADRRRVRARPRAAGRRHAARAQLLAAPARRSGFDSGRVTMARLWLPQPNDPATGPYFTQAARARFFRDYLAEAPPALRARRDLHRPAADQREPVFSFTVEGLAGGIDRGRDRARLVRRR